MVVVSISLSSGFSFQVVGDVLSNRQGCYRFNLVIERLLISGRLQKRASGAYTWPVSISLSSGFSFQASSSRKAPPVYRYVSISLSSGFSFQVIDLLYDRHGGLNVSISLSSGFSFQAHADNAGEWADMTFQSRYRAASHFRYPNRMLKGFTSSFQSRYRAASHFRIRLDPGNLTYLRCFNLVIERLLISGMKMPGQTSPRSLVSISLSSGFSFQVLQWNTRIEPKYSFNLVIERLLISGAIEPC